MGLTDARVRAILALGGEPGRSNTGDCSDGNRDTPSEDRGQAQEDSCCDGRQQVLSVLRRSVGSSAFERLAEGDLLVEAEGRAVSTCGGLSSVLNTAAAAGKTTGALQAI